MSGAQKSLSPLDSLHLGAVMPPISDAAAAQPAYGQEHHRQPVQAQQHDKPGFSAITAAVDLTAGTAAGIAQLLVGHPFDTVKVRERE